jgi:hypothetical protein
MIFVNDREYMYSVKTIEINNLLATGRVDLREYIVMDGDGKEFKLYKTRGGNWYDIPDLNAGAEAGLLSLLKWGIDLKDKMGN